MNTEEISKIVERKWNELKNKGTNHEKFLSRLEQMKDIEIGIFGGAVRDWVLNKEPKDIDIVINIPGKEYDKFLQVYHFDKNKFNGNIIRIGNTTFDIWKIEDTYAFKSGQFNPSWSNLTRSVPFNIDSVVSVLYNKTYQYLFLEGIQSKTIEFVNREIRNPDKISDRANKFARKYEFELDNEIQIYIERNKRKSILGSIEQQEENMISSND